MAATRMEIAQSAPFPSIHARGKLWQPLLLGRSHGRGPGFALCCRISLTMIARGATMFRWFASPAAGSSCRYRSWRSFPLFARTASCGRTAHPCQKKTAYSERVDERSRTRSLAVALFCSNLPRESRVCHLSRGGRAVCPPRCHKELGRSVLSPPPR